MWALGKRRLTRASPRESPTLCRTRIGQSATPVLDLQKFGESEALLAALTLFPPIA